MSPFQTQVIDASLAEFDRNAAQREQQIRDQQAKLGVLGAGRAGVQLAEFGTGAARERALLDAQLRLQFTVSGSADTSSNYDEAHKYLISNGSFSTFTRTNQTEITLTATVQNSVSGNAGLLCYLYNLNNSSEFSLATVESSFYASTNNARGFAGGGTLTVAQSCDGVNLLMNTGNITGGTFTLYKVV